MSEVLVIGHKNPDTDSICAAIGYAEFKQRTGMPNAVAARCGDTNDRIDFVLRTFGFPAPRFVANVAPKVRDVMQDNVVSLPPTATVAEALGLMDERNIRVLPVLNEDRSCRGLLSLFKMSKFFFPAPHRLFDSRTVHASLRNLARTLSAEMLFVQDPDRVESLILMIGAMSLEAFAKRLPLYPREKLIVIVGDREDVQDLAIDRCVRAIVITGGSKVSDERFDAARRNGVSMLISPHDSATTAMLSRTSITVENMIHDKFLAFQAEEYLADVRGLATASVFQAFPVLDERQRVVGILSKSDLLRKVDRQLILVDHNELSQAVNGAETADIIEVIDHHRVGLMSRTPILFRNEPVGSTSTIVAEMFLRYRLEMSPSLAGILLAGIVSDTLNLTSPTTTERDADILETLESISGVNATAFTEKLFASGSLLVTKTAQQAVATDCKEYSENGRVFSVAQIEEMGFDQFWKRKKEVIKALAEHRETNEYFFSALLITDVVTQSSLLLLAGTDAFVAKIEYPEIEPDIYELRGIVSRKKQLLPYLTHCLEQCASS
ncbi:MAG: putative manganese-dependent inorganic diphosphatase [Verrucomicrobia bacterium]|nr:MAG: putative manganese-dependent inorganic diphosphatase [Verrucomicrobiota bacterium]